jgi:uncharacterized protein (TIGR04551 family)
MPATGAATISPAGAAGAPGTSPGGSSSGVSGASGGAGGSSVGLVPSSASGGSGGSSGSGASGATLNVAPTVDPAKDQGRLAAQGAERPATDGSIGSRPSDVYSDDWWGHTRPILELHGYFRTRAELFHNFSLGRHSMPGTDAQNLWPNPLDNGYVDTSGTPHPIALCSTPDALGNYANCTDKSQATANLRFRINPELHISDNLRILSQIDALDNLVLGSTPDAYAIQPSTKNGYTAAGYNGNAPLGVLTTTQGAPTAGVNGYRNSIDVKRAWAEYMTPIGQLRFGRMPAHWGLGMVQNSGDGIDSDYQTTQDRIMFTSGIKSIDLYFGGSWNFVSTGTTSASSFDVYGGQPYNTNNLSNVNEYALFIARRMNPELQRLSLSRGDVVINGGLYTSYRSQILDVTATRGTATTPITPTDTSAVNNGLERRSAYLLMPDPWLQILWRKFRFEAEFAAVIGSIGKTPDSANVNNSVDVRQYGLTTQTEFKAIEDKLRLQFGFGWASGDPWVQSLAAGPNGLPTEQNGGQGPISTFRFNPDYRVDLIFFRHLLSRVEGAYYFRPSVEYDFLRNANGQKFGGGAAVIWSRASQFEQAPGHKRDLGVELDVSLYYQAKDGSLNDDPTKVGGFYSMLQYGVFFPLGGLNYLPGEGSNTGPNLDLSAAQTVRLFLGVAY